jgi:hypothetical protein
MEKYVTSQSKQMISANGEIISALTQHKQAKIRQEKPQDFCVGSV